MPFGVKIKDGDYPDAGWAEHICLLGQGGQTCRYLVILPDGFSCEKHTGMGRTLDIRVRRGEMTARGDNCRGKDARGKYP